MNRERVRKNIGKEKTESETESGRVRKKDQKRTEKEGGRKSRKNTKQTRRCLAECV